MSKVNTVEVILGNTSERIPFIAEQVAIDITSGLRATEVGLRSFRSRPLLRRFWEGVTGDGQERITAIAADLRKVQSSSLQYVEVILAEGVRTQICLEKTLNNLIAVNQELEIVASRTCRLERLVEMEVDSLRLLYIELKKESQSLMQKIESTYQKIEREAALRRMEAMLKSGDLYPGFDLIFKNTLYLAQVARWFANEPRPRQLAEWSSALATIKTILPQKPESIVDLFLRVLIETDEKNSELLHFLTSKCLGPTSICFNTLVERRRAALPINETIVKENLEIVRLLHDPSRSLQMQLLRPWELAETLAREILLLHGEGK